MNLTAITNQKPSIYMQKIKRKKPKHNTKENYQNTRRETKRRRKEERTVKTPENNLKNVIK